MQPSIISIYPWADFMPGCGTGHLMCVIKFNIKVSDVMITDITFTNDMNEKHIHDIKVVDDHQYEHRGNEIVIRNGPQWSRCNVVAQVTLEHDNNNYVLTSNPKKINQVC